MKILFPIGTFYPAQSGGPSNTVYWLAKALVKKNIEVSVVTTSKDIKDSSYKFDEWLNIDGIKVCYTNRNKYPFKILHESFSELKKVDIVHLTSLFDIISLPIALASLFFKKKIIWSVRGELEDYALSHRRKKGKNIFLKIIRMFKNKIIFHSTSTSETNNIIRVLGEEVSIIELPNYIELPQKKKIEYKKQLLFVGRIHKIKSIHNLIYGLSMSNEFKESDFFLKIAGVGDEKYRDELNDIIKEEKLENKVFLLNRRVEGDEKQRLYAESFFSFLVSESENFGAVVVESMAQGTPVITSKGTPWNELEKEKSGFWIDNTPESIASKIDEVLTMDKKEYIEMRRKAYSHVLKKYDVDKNINKWIQEYNV
ncbi:glycosyltransferase family 4 protein [Tenacibaculum sp.]|uniref:glycosyltransferase family 4 protein n=1 Tax=Tenacibaculum sp. TaxID=1906242 RepID=UPI003AA9A616